MNKIVEVCCIQCEETDVSYSPDTGEAYCWTCNQRVRVITRVVNQ